MVSRPYGLRVLKGYYCLYDVGYPNAKGFLAPYRGERYHPSDWRGTRNAPTTAREFFNMKHSSARNVIERAFGLLKGWWAIIRGKSFYPIQVQCRTITACCLIHNLITMEMGIGAMLDVPNEENSASVGLDGDHIEFVESSEE
ncbi:protein ALP1-like [Benincasa hispida]|uniref:protein ALP1-like n=1 Tax=Benincasa hispida TaxID=102211 RepID=UPI0019028DBD|nr:protein ALP1-like [Benincasa hispida]